MDRDARIEELDEQIDAFQKAKLSLESLDLDDESIGWIEDLFSDLTWKARQEKITLMGTLGDYTRTFYEQGAE